MIGNYGSPSAPAVWVPKPQQNAKALRLFRDGMDEMHEALWFPPDEAWRMRRAGRRASVELRKLLLDGSPLVHRVLHRPRFHPLRSKDRLAGDVYRDAKTLQIRLGAKDGRLLTPAASQTWAIAVHPLNGLRYENASKKWHLEPLFDVDARPTITLNTWLRQRLYRVNGREYSLWDTLKFVSNKEGVHVDIEKDTEVRDMERVHFGHVTYPHLVTMLVASYLLHQYRTSFREDEDRWTWFTGTEGHPPGEYKVIRDAEFCGEIFPLGFEGEFHETRIPFPTPGRPWTPTKSIEQATVEA